MAFVCVLDVVIHFISFRNIDLASQGTYAIKARAFCDLREKGGKSKSDLLGKSSTGVLVALPISCTSDHNIKHILSAEYEEQNPPGIEVRNFSPKISLDDTSAVTRSFKKFSHFYANAKTISFLDGFNSPKNDREDSSSDSEDNDMSFS
eukprot:GHVP01016425.1.p1 GENE.GHVP01016425.1~~GHVP01016425.1.p1  ORF type:complete len:149 (+),score=22.46 GHVP01016425.1:65-511(+)